MPDSVHPVSIALARLGPAPARFGPREGQGRSRINVGWIVTEVAIRNNPSW